MGTGAAFFESFEVAALAGAIAPPPFFGAGFESFGGYKKIGLISTTNGVTKSK